MTASIVTNKRGAIAGAVIAGGALGSNWGPAGAVCGALFAAILMADYWANEMQ